ncbi:MAG: Xaa-Pro dipeptidase [Methanomassiliicoccales archaeon PtaU1.Bin124]|nr:MAG: Xaa-Pro dipeptidase [Methanomassiliicoccales archaeon PtaU1.Bin124]
MESRAKRIYRYLDDDIDAVLFMNDEEPNVDTMFPYATGTAGGLFEGCQAIVWPDSKVDLLSTVLEETSARLSTAHVTVFRNPGERDDLLRRLLGSAKRVGVNARGLSYNNYSVLKKALPKAKFIDISSALLHARVVKDKDELKRLQKACDIVSKVADEIPDIITPGMTELEAAAELNYRMQRYGATGPSFTTIAGFGPNSAEPHHEPDGTKLRKNDFALFDFGALFQKYGSDLTRTFFYGRATKEQKRIYQTTLEAQLAGIDAIRPGITGKEVDAVARSIIDSSEFKGLFIHSLGHSIGLSVHDGARMAPTSDLVLEEGMVLTVEPGIYVRGKGGVRIEDDIVVTKKGCKVLTSASKEMRVV